MPVTDTAWDRVQDGQMTAPDLRRDSAVRREKSGPALRAFFNIASKWGLNGEEQRGLLGWPARSTFQTWKAGRRVALTYDTLVRVSLMLGIYKALHILYPNDRFADGWVKVPNTNTLFGGRAPIAFMVGGDVDSLYAVRRLLDARRGGWS